MRGQILKRQGGYLIRMYLGRDPETGRRRYANERVHGNKKAAERRFHEMAAEHGQGVYVEPARVSLGAYLDEWLEESAARRVRARTLSDYRWLLKRYVRPHVGELRLDRLRPLHVQKMIGKLEAEGLSPKTIRHAYTVLLGALNQAVRWQLLRVNPAQAVDLPRMTRRTIRTLDPEEVRAFRAAIRGRRHEALLLLLVGTGLRPSEALGLRWGDVDLDAGRVRIERTLLRRQPRRAQRGGAPAFEEPKTERSRRVVPLPESVSRGLREHRAAQAADRLKKGALYADHGLVFASKIGGPLDQANVKHRHFKPALERAELPTDLRLYDLRHTAATTMLNAGVPVQVVSERLGHASAKMTLDVYAGVQPQHAEQSAAALEAALFQG